MVSASGQLSSGLKLHKNFSKSLPTVAWFGKKFCSQSRQPGFEGDKMRQHSPICGHNLGDGQKEEQCIEWAAGFSTTLSYKSQASSLDRPTRQI